MSNKKSKGTFTPKLRFPEFQNSGKWAEYRLGKISTRIIEKVGDLSLTPVSITAGKGFVLQAEKFGRDISGQQYKNYIVLNRGDFAYNKGNSKKYPQGCIYKLKEFEQVAAPNVFICFRLENDHVADFYQCYFDTNFHGPQLQKFITSSARGTGLLNISAEDFFSIIFLSPNKKEQQKIADCLTSLDELIAAERAQVDALQAYKKGLLQALFPAEGKSVPALRFPEFQSAGEWEEKTLGDLGKLILGLTYSPSDIRDDGLLVLRSSNIRDGLIVLDDCVYVTPDIKRANLSQPNDILICVRNGSTALIGKNAIIPEDMPLCTHGAFMTVFRAENPKFAYQLLQTKAYQSQVAAGLGARINSINNSQLLNYSFFVPTAPEQQKIAELLRSTDEEIAAQGQRLAALQVHKQGLLQGLFPSAGEVDE